MFAGILTHDGRISIHALLAESDNSPNSQERPHTLFLSTLSLRRATTGGQSCNSTLVHFYPRSPCGERLHMGVTVLGIQHISIHALLAESDPYGCYSLRHSAHFYPRSPCGERRCSSKIISSSIVISIHALLAESDAQNLCVSIIQLIFLSTLSLRRATPRLDAEY